MDETKLQLKSDMLDFDDFEVIFPSNWDGKRIQGTYEMPVIVILGAII